MVNEVLGGNIRKFRLAQSWTQEKLADALSVSHQVISKWENGIATPDVEILCVMAQIFGTSLDSLCGMAPEKAEVIIEEIETELRSGKNTYDALYTKWESIEKPLELYPTHEKLLFATLKLLRAMHDKIETDAQKEEVNAQILKISERILDFSREDSYRSYANYNLALYYSEQVNLRRGNELDRANAERAKRYGELVLYKDMHKTYYNFLGAANVEDDCAAREKTLIELIDATKQACRNLLNCYQCYFEEDASKKTAYNEVFEFLKELETAECGPFKKALIS